MELSPSLFSLKLTPPLSARSSIAILAETHEDLSPPLHMRNLSMELRFLLRLVNKSYTIRNCPIPIYQASSCQCWESFYFLWMLTKAWRQVYTASTWRWWGWRLLQIPHVSASSAPISTMAQANEEDKTQELHRMRIPSAFTQPWPDSPTPLLLHSYLLSLTPVPADRLYKEFAIFVSSPLPTAAANLKVDLHLDLGRFVLAQLLPSSSPTQFNPLQLLEAQNFQKICLNIILNRSLFLSDAFVLDQRVAGKPDSSTFYLLLPVITHQDDGNKISVDWNTIQSCLSSPLFNKNPSSTRKFDTCSSSDSLLMANGLWEPGILENSLVYYHPDAKNDILAYHPEADFYFVTEVLHHKKCDIQLSHTHQQPLLKGKRLFRLKNLLYDRQRGNPAAGKRVKKEQLCELPPELCLLKILGFSKELGSSLSLLPSIMHRLENFLVAIELMNMFSISFPGGNLITPDIILQAITAENCKERFSYEKLKVLGSSFLKFAVARHLFLLHDAFDEGVLTKLRSDITKSSNLHRLALSKSLQAFIRDQQLTPAEFFALGRPCHVETTVFAASVEGKCSRCYHLLYKKAIADVVEALVGGFVVCSGFKAAVEFLRWIGMPVDFKTQQLYHTLTATERFRVHAGSIDVDALEMSLDYMFKYKGLLVQAFVHPSCDQSGGGNERLEYLGDAVLDYLVTSYLYSVYPSLKSCELAELRTATVMNDVFTEIAMSRSLHKFMIFRSTHLAEVITSSVKLMEAGTHGDTRCKALANLVEACVGAILLDSGLDMGVVWRVTLSFIDSMVNYSRLQQDPLREMLELCQSCKLEWEFKSSKEDGIFFVEVVVRGDDVCLYSHSTNVSKSVAKKAAAKHMFEKLTGHGFKLKSSSLEVFLLSNNKKEAMLIGYDETPVEVPIPTSTQQQTTNITNSSYTIKCRGDFCEISDSENKPHNCDTLSSATCLDGEENVGGQSSKQKIVSETQSGRYSPCEENAKLKLNQMCVKKGWKLPSYECCKEEGPCHAKLFTCKMKVEVVDRSCVNLVVECMGGPCSKKRDAGENAAAGALWYLRHAGHLPTN